MKIGFDAKRLFHNNSGLGNYSRSLVHSLLKFYPENDYFLYTPSFTEDTKTDFLNHFSNTTIKTPSHIISKTFKSSWRSLRMAAQIRKDHIDVYHGLSHELPYNIQRSNALSVVTIHDLIFMRYPHYYNFIDRKIYKTKFQYSCEVADKIIAISEQTKSDIIEFFNTDEKKIEVISPSIHSNFKKEVGGAELKAIKEKYKLPSEYLLYVGTVEPRKNLATLIKALHLLKSDIPLVVVGKHTNYIDNVNSVIENESPDNRIIFIENADFNDLSAIYSGATVFIYPSLFEGFGLPVVEAMFCKTPVITSNTSCLPESAGDAALLVRPTDAQEMSNAINRVLTDSELRKSMIEKGLIHAQRYSEEHIAVKMEKMYTELYERRNSKSA
jgi:glycosyltransferase involved in cell wall biosynthesis